MTIFVGCVGAKGGSGKSTMSRLIATALIRAGFTAKIADLDRQRTCLAWAAKREDFRRAIHIANQRKKPGKQIDVDLECPRVPVEYYGILDMALSDADQFDYYVLDSAGKASREILEIARVADVVVMPLNPSGDDMWPTASIYRELVKLGIPQRKIVAVLNRVGGPEEEREAREYLTQSGAQVLGPVLREMRVFRSAMTVGRSPVEAKGANPRAEAERVAESLINIIGEIYSNVSEGSGSEASSSENGEIRLVAN